MSHLAVNFCPHCHSGNDPVLKDTTWSCGVRFNDSTWRTKECFKRNLESANERIKRLVQAGDCLLSHRNSTDYHEKVREWDKAKKDKP